MPEPTTHPLADARHDLAAAHRAAADGDHHRRDQYVRSAVDAAAEAVLHPGATAQEAGVARRLLAEALALDERPHPRRADRLGPDATADLCDADRTWIDDYLARRRPPGRPAERCLEL